MKIRVKKLTETAILPKKGTNYSAGFDLCADNYKTVTIMPGETVMLQTELAFEIPKGYFGAIFARSGISTKRGLRPATCVSVIDSDYRGSVGVPIHNDSENVQFVDPHERIAQMVIIPCPEIEIEEATELTDTERSDGGFGSTGR